MIFKFQYDNTLSFSKDKHLWQRLEFKFQYDNTLSWRPVKNGRFIF